MKHIRILFLAFIMTASVLSSSSSEAFSGMGCGTQCWANIQGFCPTCNANLGVPRQMPWGNPVPDFWNTGPMMFSNFYTPGPWSYVPPVPPLPQLQLNDPAFAMNYPRP